MKLFYGLLTITLFFISCNKGPEKAEYGKEYNIVNYYYPLHDLEQGKIYVYSSVEDGQTIKYYWKIQSRKEVDGRQLLISKRYNQSFVSDQEVEEQIVPSGSVAIRYQLAYFDSVNNKIDWKPTNIVAAPVFPFQAVFDTVQAYRFRMKWVEPVDTMVQTDFIKDRFFAGFTQRTVNGKTYNCAVIKLKNLRELSRKDGGFWKNEYRATEYYAEGKGLVDMETMINGKAIRTSLEKVLTVEEFEKLASAGSQK